jgi:hypothetical protein
MSNHGQKVTNTKEGQENPVYEGGFVTKDSLAAESVNDGGSYGEGNPHNGVSSQPSKSSNLSTTDTSAAEKLGAASTSGNRTNSDSAEDTFDSGRIDPYTHKALSSDDSTASDNQQRDFSSTSDNQQKEQTNVNSSYDEDTLNTTKGTRSETVRDNDGFGQDQTVGQDGDFGDSRSKKEIIEERRTNLPMPDQPPVASDWNSMVSSQ